MNRWSRNYGGTHGFGAWRTLADIGYIGIVIWESLAALVLIHGTRLLLRAWLRDGKLRPRPGTPANADYTHGRRVSSAGLLMVLVLFGLGFIGVGGEWFSMWQSGQWNGLSAATRNFTLAAFAIVLLHLPSPEWNSSVTDVESSGDSDISQDERAAA